MKKEHKAVTKPAMINVTIRISLDEKINYSKDARNSGRSLASHISYLARNSNAK